MNTQRNQELYDIFNNSIGVVIDSRKVLKGVMFFALKGNNSNGNDFALDAIKNGAICAVVDEEKYKDEKGCFYVEDVLQALQSLSNLHRKTFNFPIIALTGSNGKTTTKELIREVLKQKYKVLATIGNLNNHIGVPLTLLSVRENLDFLIVEMGANHQKEIDFLCTIAEPDYGLITNIGKAHLEGFGGIEGVKIGKSELYKYISKKNGKLFVNQDDLTLSHLIPPHSSVIDYRSSDIKINKQEHQQLNISIENHIVQTNLFGDYNLHNIAAAVYIGKFFNVEITKICKAISSYMPDNNRSELSSFGSNKVIKDAYNANPSSMKLSIQQFADSSFDNKVLIIGDMFELGIYAEQEHRHIVELVNKYKWKDVIFVGKNFFQFKQDNPFHFCTDLIEAKSTFDQANFQNCTILLKGSRGIALEKLIS